MGCDIHMFIEKKANEKYDIWERVSLYYINEYTHDLECAEPYNGRDYELFSLLAGVRGWYEPFDFCRGLPDSVSSKIEAEHAGWGMDCHSTSWYDLCELNLFIKEFKLNNAETEVEKEEGMIPRLEKFWEGIVNYLEFAGEFVWDIKPNKYRIVFWFDN